MARKSPGRRYSARRHPPEPRRCATETVVGVDLRFPPEDVPGDGDVGAAALRVVDDGVDVVDGRIRPDDVPDPLRDLTHRQLVRVAEVHRARVVRAGEREQPADGVLDVADGPGLLTAAGDGDRLALQGLVDEG